MSLIFKLLSKMPGKRVSIILILDDVALILTPLFLHSVVFSILESIFSVHVMSMVVPASGKLPFPTAVWIAGFLFVMDKGLRSCWPEKIEIEYKLESKTGKELLFYFSTLLKTVILPAKNKTINTCTFFFIWKNVVSLSIAISPNYVRQLSNAFPTSIVSLIHKF